MAQIPRSSPGSTQLRTQSVLPTQSATAEQNYVDSLGQGLQTIGGAIESVADQQYKKLYEARKFTDTTNAKLYASQAMADSLIKHERKTVTGPDGKVMLPTGSEEDFSSFDNDVKSIRDKVKSFFHSKDDEQEFLANLDLETITARNQLQKSFLKNQIDIGKVAILEESKSLSDKYALTGDKAFLDKQKELWDTAAAKGFYDADVAYNKNEAAKKEANWNLFTNVTKTKGIEEAKTMVVNNEFGMDFDSDKALSYLEHARNLEKKDAVQTQINGRFAYTQALASGQESLYNPSPKFQAVIDNDPVLSEAYNNAIKSKKTYWAGKGNEDYVNAVRRASEATSADSLSALTAAAILEGKLNAEQMGAYLFYANNRARTLQLTEKDIFPVDVSTEETTKQAMIDAGLNSIIRWSRTSGADVALHSKVTAQYLQDVQNNKGSPYELVANSIKKANIELNPDIINYPKEGQMFVDAYGRMGVAFPDGRVQSMGTPVSKSTKPTAKATTQGSEDEDDFEAAKGFKKNARP